MQKNIAVIIPTYNACNTIITLLDKIIREIPNALVVIVDDNSPDKTAKLVRDRFSKDKRIMLIVRKEKGGRGSAVIKGLQEGLKFPAIRYFIEMDADLCHNPTDIPSLIKAANEADVVIASRYLDKSHTIDWKWKRRIFSRLVSLFLAITLKIPILDYTNGFRCYTRNIIESVDFDKIQSKGFIVLSELAYYIHKKGGRFKEIPFTFQLLELNPSNMDIHELQEAVFTIFRLLATGK